MAVILEGTQFEYAVENSVQARKLVYTTKAPNSILINIANKNTLNPFPFLDIPVYYFFKMAKFNFVLENYFQIPGLRIFGWDI